MQTLLVGIGSREMSQLFLQKPNVLSGLTLP